MAYLDYTWHPSILAYSRTDTHQLLGNKFPVYNYCMYHYSSNHIFPVNILKKSKYLIESTNIIENKDMLDCVGYYCLTMDHPQLIANVLKVELQGSWPPIDMLNSTTSRPIGVHVCNYPAQLTHALSEML